ncbi:MAG: class I SAM-dependent methyltransferase [Candidatus Aenigmarchaeota archaeon]|nr:class I SAM-dependent methyltransferase [Candidatus Aenigmarchaeota archaeon]
MINPKKEIKNLRKVYDIIADSWTNLRNKPEKEVVEFAKNKKGLILDLGCGNCRQSIPFLENNCRCVGVDFSSSMIKQAKKFLEKKKFKMDFVLANVYELPFKKNSFDYSIYIRTFSNLPTKEMRLKSLKELKRICKKDILFSVWKGDSEDKYVNWNYYGKKLKRFYHLYTMEELKSDLKSAKIKPKKISYDSKRKYGTDKVGNIWCII